MRKSLSFLAVLAMVAAPLTSAHATDGYSVTLKLNHIHITQGAKVTISGQVRGGSTSGKRVAIHATDGAAPFANNFSVGNVKVSHGRFTATYAPVIAGRLVFSGVVTNSDRTPISGAGPNSHSLLVAAAHPKDSSHQMVVIGDSISDPGVYNDRHGSANRAWWSYLSSKTGLQANVFAQRGSGYLKAGKCTSSTIDGRVTDAPIAARLATAAAVVIEAGVNDFDECVRDKDGVVTTQPSTAVHRWYAIRKTMIDIDNIVADNARVYVIVPWGPRDSIAQYREEIVRTISSAAAAHGFQYVDLAAGTLTVDNTRDGVHPNALGTVAIYRALYHGSDLRTRFPG